MARCDDCGRPARKGATTTTGRRLCEQCSRDLAAYAGAASAMVSGAGVGESLVTGVSTRAYAGAFTGEAEAARGRREKLDRTSGFWRRLWVRVVG